MKSAIVSIVALALAPLVAAAPVTKDTTVSDAVAAAEVNGDAVPDALVQDDAQAGNDFREGTMIPTRPNPIFPTRPNPIFPTIPIPMIPIPTTPPPRPPFSPAPVAKPRPVKKYTPELVEWAGRTLVGKIEKVLDPYSIQMKKAMFRNWDAFRKGIDEGLKEFKEVIGEHLMRLPDAPYTYGYDGQLKAAASDGDDLPEAVQKHADAGAGVEDAVGTAGETDARLARRAEDAALKEGPNLVDFFFKVDNEKAVEKGEAAESEEAETETS